MKNTCLILTTLFVLVALSGCAGRLTKGDILATLLGIDSEFVEELETKKADAQANGIRLKYAIEAAPVHDVNERRELYQSARTSHNNTIDMIVSDLKLERKVVRSNYKNSLETAAEYDNRLAAWASDVPASRGFGPITGIVVGKLLQLAQNKGRDLAIDHFEEQLVMLSWEELEEE